MPIEYTMLTLMTLFFLFAWLPSSIGKYFSYGGKWLASNRDYLPGRELSPWAARTERAYTNLKDYFPGFAVAIVLLGLTGQFDETTKCASIAYVVARLGHFFFYGIGSVHGRFVSYLVAMVSNVVLLLKIIY